MLEGYPPCPPAYMTIYGKTQHMGLFVKIEFDKLYHRANPPASLRLIVCFALEIVSFVCDRATCIENEKLRSKGVAMYAYSVSAYYV